MTIMLSEIWPISSLQSYKVHFARWNGDNQPLEVWARDQDEWRKWQEYRPSRDEFNRPMIFSLAQFYHETNSWLFTGIYRVLERPGDRYVVELSVDGTAFIGRLKITSPYRGRSTRVRLENHFASFEVAEILREPYTGRSFPGFESINVSFEELETIVRKDRPDWKAALSSMKGIYLISDTVSGKRYVGSAYGESGIWSRWCSYIDSGHGGNVELKSLVSDPTLDYCRKAFRFALLEHRPNSTPDEVVIAREGFWKEVLLTRGENGFNRN